MYKRIFELPPRHPRQTAANYAFNGRCAYRAAAFALLRCHVTPNNWLTMHYVYRFINHFVERYIRPIRKRTATLRLLAAPRLR